MNVSYQRSTENTQCTIFLFIFIGELVCFKIDQIDISDQIDLINYPEHYSKLEKKCLTAKLTI